MRVFLRVFLVLLSSAYCALQGDLGTCPQENLSARLEVRGKLGQNVSLGCRGPTDADVKVFTWTKDGHDPDYVFFYRNNRSYASHQHQSFRGRVGLTHSSSLKDGDFSVVLQNLSRMDAGTYECRIVTRNPGGEDGLFQNSINLTVSGNEEEQPKERGEEAGGDQRMTDGTDVFLFAGVGFCLIVVLLIIGCWVLKKSAGFRSGSFSEKRSPEAQQAMV
ncbi:uncharacterized protein LOC124880607 isoform X1 [Girardinichthys multiradiatus]|uniref:uncharacterized protein LOC124880607 isoform X1 n=1 Tax=Girardinichthys multiradiatus TaxID=208333 RepID=UPI001FACCFD8|nr:uncharacterized protein LOC124880607 isoform X1 [Girardinichthys multiradiatus]